MFVFKEGSILLTGVFWMLAEMVGLAEFRQDAKACREDSTVNNTLKFILKGERDEGRKNKILRDADLPSTVILPHWWLIISPFEPNRPATLHSSFSLLLARNLLSGIPFVGFKMPLCCGECEGREFNFFEDMLKAYITGWALHPTQVAGSHFWFPGPLSLAPNGLNRLESGSGYIAACCGRSVLSCRVQAPSDSLKNWKESEGMGFQMR